MIRVSSSDGAFIFLCEQKKLQSFGQSEWCKELLSQKWVLLCPTCQGREPAKDEHVRFASLWVSLLDVYLSIAIFWMDLICNLVQINVLICVHISSFPFPALAESLRAFPKSSWVDLIISFMLAVILWWFSYWWLHHCHLERAIGDSLRFSCDVHMGNGYYLQNCTPTMQLEACAGWLQLP